MVSLWQDFVRSDFVLVQSNWLQVLLDWYLIYFCHKCVLVPYLFFS